MNIFNSSIIPALLFSFTLFGCGGGGDGGSDSSSVEVAQPAPKLQIPAGVWTGPMEREGWVYANPFYVDAIVSTNGEVRINASNKQFIGFIDVNSANDGFISDDVSFHEDAFGYGNFALTSTGSLTASISSEKLHIKFTDNDDTFTFVLEPTFESPVSTSLETISGSYSDISLPNFEIDETGSIEGYRLLGFIWSGDISQHDVSVNVYSITLATENCGEYSGIFSGLGFYSPNSILNDVEGNWLLWHIDNGETVLSLAYSHQ